MLLIPHVEKVRRRRRSCLPNPCSSHDIVSKWKPNHGSQVQRNKNQFISAESGRQPPSAIYLCVILTFSSGKLCRETLQFLHPRVKSSRVATPRCFSTENGSVCGGILTKGRHLMCKFTGRHQSNPPKLADFNNFSDSLPCAVFGLASAVSRDFHDVDRSVQRSNQARPVAVFRPSVRSLLQAAGWA